MFLMPTLQTCASKTGGQGHTGTVIDLTDDWSVVEPDK